MNRTAWGLLAFLLAPNVYALGDETNQTTEGWCSPAVNNTDGNVSIQCQGLSQQDIDRLLAVVKEGLSGFDSLKTIEQQTRMLKNLLDQVDEKSRTITSLEQTIAGQTTRIQSILTDDSINDDIKALIADGKLEAAEQLVDQNSQQLADQGKKLAARHYQRGRVKELRIKYDEARVSFEKAAILQPNNTQYLNAAGSIYHDLGKYHKAIEYYELALASDLKTFGEHHPQVAIYRNNLGMAWQSLGEYKRAIEYYELALASGLKTYGEDHPQVAIRRNNLGLAWQSLGEYKRAIEYYELALASDLKTFGEDHPNVAIRRNNLGAAWQSLGEYKRAIEYYEMALASDLKTYGEHHPDVAIRRNNLGSAWNALGEYDKAIEYYEMALVVFENKLGLDHPTTKTIAENLASVRDKLKKQ